MIRQYSPTALVPERAGPEGQQPTVMSRRAAERSITIRNIIPQEGESYESRSPVTNPDLVNSVLYLISSKYRELNEEGRKEFAQRMRLFVCNSVTPQSFAELDGGKLSTAMTQQFGVGALDVFLNVIKDKDGVPTKAHVDIIAKALNVNIAVIKDGNVHYGWKEFDEDRIATIIVNWHGLSKYTPIIVIRRKREVRSLSSSDPLTKELDRLVRSVRGQQPELTSLI